MIGAVQHTQECCGPATPAFESKELGWGEYHRSSDTYSSRVGKGMLQDKTHGLSNAAKNINTA